MRSGQRCGGKDSGPGPGAVCGRGRGRVPWGSYGEGSRGRCGEGARRSPRGRVRARRRCGEGRVEDTWRCSRTIAGRCGKTIEVSVRQVLHTVDEKPRGKSVRFPPHTKSSNSPCAPDASCSMQHDACSMQPSSVQHARCNGKQRKCNFLHARDGSMLASMHCAVLHLSVQPSQRQSQSHAKGAPTNAPWQILTCPST